MNLFANLKVNTKLLLILVLALIGFAAIGVTYFTVLKIQKNALDNANNFAEISNHIKDLDIELGDMLIVTKNFRINKDPKALEEFDQHHTTMDNLLGKISAASTNSEILNDVPPISEALNNYHAAVYQSAESQITVGVNDSAGLSGEARAAAQVLETKLQQLLKKFPDLQPLITSYLQMRRYENDYLTRVDDKSVKNLRAEAANFEQLLESQSFTQASENEIGFTGNLKGELKSLQDSYMSKINDLISAVADLKKDNDTADESLKALDAPVEALSTKVAEVAKQIADQAGMQRERANLVFIGVLVAMAVLIGLGMLLIGSSITTPLRRLQGVIQQVAGGDMSARAQFERGDEIGQLAVAFDNLLDERVTRLAEIEHENERLNSSVIGLLEAVARLSERDLTTQVPVAEDVTGAIADALNLLTSETASVLTEVTHISDDVAAASRNVKSQADNVAGLAKTEREQVVRTSGELATAAEAMKEIAELAQNCDRAAQSAIQRTQVALETVTSTVNGINATRDVIRETEKRIKRLGERSQEISGVVNLINSIAERTHILALNASMHAASAGEAGRGFAVVADEVQRLAENARQATEQIAGLVRNIQTETMDTVTTMNSAISQVVEGSRLAEQAGERMKETQESTAALVASVRRIAEGSQVQAKMSDELRIRARQIEESTLKTNQQLQEQNVQTDNLLSYASRLVDAVRVFKLPGLDDQDQAQAAFAGQAPAAMTVEKGARLKVVEG